MPAIRNFFIAFSAIGLSGCLETNEPVSVAAPAADQVAGPEEQTARDACIRDVAATTGNNDVSVISSSFSEAGTQVSLRVGTTGTWSCIGYSNGTTAGIMSTTNEGSL